MKYFRVIRIDRVVMPPYPKIRAIRMMLSMFGLVLSINDLITLMEQMKPKTMPPIVKHRLIRDSCMLVKGLMIAPSVS